MAVETRQLTRGYARAILAVAEASAVVDVVENDLRDVAETYTRSSALREFLANPGLEGAAKRAALEELLAKKVHPIVMAHLGLMAEQAHGRYLSEVVADYIEEAAAVRGRVTAEVTTAVELSGEQAERLRAALAAHTGHAVTLRPVVDPDVGGGVVVRVGDEVIDGSVRNQLNRLRGNLAGF